MQRREGGQEARQNPSEIVVDIGASRSTLVGESAEPGIAHIHTDSCGRAQDIGRQRNERRMSPRTTLTCHDRAEARSASRTRLRPWTMNPSSEWHPNAQRRITGRGKAVEPGDGQQLRRDQWRQIIDDVTAVLGQVRSSHLQNLLTVTHIFLSFLLYFTSDERLVPGS